LTRFALGVCIIGVLVCAAPLASAGLTNPIPYSACGGDNVAGTEMTDPNGAFAGINSVRQCLQNCKLIAKQCQQIVRGVISCQVKYLGVVEKLTEQDCAVVHPDPAETKACKQLTVHLTKVNIGTQKDLGAQRLSECTAWGDTCQSTCN